MERLVNSRMTVEATLTKSITKSDESGSVVGKRLLIEARVENAAGDFITIRVENTPDGVNARMVTRKWEVVEPLKSQDEFEQKAAMCKEHRNDSDRRGGFIYYLEPAEKSDHGASPGVRMVVNLYRDESSAERRPLA